MKSAAQLPPIAPRLPFLGNAVSFLRDPLGFLRSTSEIHGDVVRVSLGPMRMTLLGHPDLVEDVLVTRNKLWEKDHFLKTTLRPILGEGLLSSEGDFWRRQRRLAQPAFHRDRLNAYAEIMVEKTSHLIDTWRGNGGGGDSKDDKTKNKGREVIRDVHKDMMRLTLEIVSQTLFGANVGDHADHVGEALEALLAVVADPFELFLPFLKRLPTPGRRRFDRAIAKLDSIIYGVIEQRRKSGAGETGETGATSLDLLSMLLHAQDEDGTRMSDKQLRDECMTLFLAGHETTALALSWTWLLLSKHPTILASLLREIDEVLGDRRAPTYSDVARLRYTRNVITESLRLYPPAWSIGRRAREDIEIGGYLVPRGEHVWFCPWAIHRDPRFFDHPNEFRPERWEGDFENTLHRYAYFPFGGGPRLCIGQSFAQMEAVIILTMLARAFRVEVLPKPRTRPVPSVTLRPKPGVHARLVPR